MFLLGVNNASLLLHQPDYGGFMHYVQFRQNRFDWWYMPARHGRPVAGIAFIPAQHKN